MENKKKKLIRINDFDKVYAQEVRELGKDINTLYKQWHTQQSMSVAKILKELGYTMTDEDVFTKSGADGNTKYITFSGYDEILYYVLNKNDMIPSGWSPTKIDGSVFFADEEYKSNLLKDSIKIKDATEVVINGDRYYIDTVTRMQEYCDPDDDDCYETAYLVWDDEGNLIWDTTNYDNVKEYFQIEEDEEDDIDWDLLNLDDDFDGDLEDLEDMILKNPSSNDINYYIDETNKRDTIDALYELFDELDDSNMPYDAYSKAYDYIQKKLHHL